MPEMMAALEKIRGSQTFHNSERLLAFLDFVVAFKLKTGEGELKETSIGVGLYNRLPTYDTKVDSIVRTQARRVRERLDEYYRTEGAGDPIRLRIPKGGYVPVVERQVPSPPSTAPEDTPSRDSVFVSAPA